MCSRSSPSRASPASKHWSARERRAGVPVKAAHLAKDARLSRRVPRRAVPGLDDVVLAERGPPPSGRAEEVGHALPGHEPLRLDRVAVLEGVERPLIVLDRVRVGVHPARPVARRHQVARAPALVGAEGPVVAEGHQPLETLRVAGALGLEGGAHAACAARCGAPRGCSGTRSPGGAHGGTGDPAPASPDRRRRARRAPRPPRRARPRPPSAAGPRSGDRSPPLPG